MGHYTGGQKFITKITTALVVQPNTLLTLSLECVTDIKDVQGNTGNKHNPMPEMIQKHSGEVNNSETAARRNGILRAVIDVDNNETQQLNNAKSKPVPHKTGAGAVIPV